MSGRTGRGTFLGEVAFGFVVSLAAAAVALTLSFVMPSSFVARLVVTGLGLTYVVRAIARSGEKTGRIVALAVWVTVAAGLWVTGAGLPVLVAAHVALVWLARSLFTYSRLIDAGLDLGLTVMALSFAILAAVRSESVFLASWCFVLVQALHVAIPEFVSRWTTPRDEELLASDPNRGFADAFKAADEALQRLAGRG
jgi:hypothetical protein